ncbi:hypothetical protein KC19_VG317300 [Ceratodon purpureus]|uniref:Uncharacterized protein n=1 Tax=Ceratodon purpureus TaxID=3225 RepID=A0A8T0HWJ4_CERPU|nr:hypothetical protein KC19_VG317300 [Ceratodon purpureus]
MDSTKWKSGKQRYERAKKPLSSFDLDIIKYKDYIDDIQAEETITNLRYVRIDNGILKHTIIEHCEAWILKFETLLHQIAKTELYSIYTYFKR